MDLDDRKIVFITCVNDELKYAECRHYLDRLYVPDGHTTDIISIREASSMAAGYNAGMQDSDARYKVYLHQDVFIKNVDFIADMLKVFACDDRIGMLGMVGKREWGKAAPEMMRWDAGKVIHDDQIRSWDVLEEESYVEVAELDGLLLATRYDIPWRDDIFTGWDFYDLSQCMEFKRAGYKIVVPRQDEVWCCHAALTSDMRAYYEHYEHFLQAYAGAEGISAQGSDEERLLYEVCKGYDEQRDRLGECVERLLDAGEKTGLRKLFCDPYCQGDPRLREYGAIVRIDQIEEQQQSSLRFWETGMSASELVLKFRILKYALKRIEYGADEPEKIGIWDRYSRYAVEEVCCHHATYKDVLCKKLEVFLRE